LSDILDGKYDLDEEEHHIIYCASGYRSNIAASYLQRNGFWDLRALAGGFIAWSRAGYPVKK
jgi:rhodanese-related sulfurtransferase